MKHKYCVEKFHSLTKKKNSNDLYYFLEPFQPYNQRYSLKFSSKFSTINILIKKSILLRGVEGMFII